MNKRIAAKLAGVQINRSVMNRVTLEHDAPLSTVETNRVEGFAFGVPSSPQYKRKESKVHKWLKAITRYQSIQRAIGESTPITVNRPYTVYDADGREITHNHYVPLFPARVNPVYRIRRVSAEKDSHTGCLGVTVAPEKNTRKRIIPASIVSSESFRIALGDIRALEGVDTFDARAKLAEAKLTVSRYLAQQSGHTERHDDSRKYTYRKPFGRSEIAKYRETVGYTADDKEAYPLATTKATLKSYHPIGRAVYTTRAKCELTVPLAIPSMGDR